jgi:hypothetical protein
MNKSRRVRWAGYVARMGDKPNAYRILVGKPEGKRPLGRPRRRWVDNIKIDLKRDRMGWYGLDRLTLVNTMMNFQVPQSAGKFLSIYTIGSLSRRDQLGK